MCRTICRNVIASIVCMSLVGPGMLPASASVIGTDQYLTLQDRDARISRIDDALLQDRVRDQLTALGVDPEDARQRVAALTDADLAVLDERIQDMPAGGFLELVLVAFLVILILDLTGLTDIFPGIGPGKTRQGSTS
jgi:hypothetical protein